MLPAFSTTWENSPQRHFDQVLSQLSDLGITYELNPRLVRGLDYYTHTAFEIQSNDLGSQSAVCGGGRYDGLVEELGGPATPAVGWAIGMERLTLLLEKLNPPPSASPDLYIVSRGEKAEANALQLAQKASPRWPGRRTRPSAVRPLANSSSGPTAVVPPPAWYWGTMRLLRVRCKLKWLQSGEQTSLSQGELLNDLEGLQQKIAGLK